MQNKINNNNRAKQIANIQAGDTFGPANVHEPKKSVRVHTHTICVLHVRHELYYLLLQPYSQIHSFIYLFG